MLLHSRAILVLVAVPLLLACGARSDLDPGGVVRIDAGRSTRDAGRLPRDAGSVDTGARDAGGPAPSCDGRFLCRGVPHTTGTTVLDLFPGVGVGNVAVGPSTRLDDTIVVGWGARTCCSPRKRSASGVALIRPTSLDSVLVFPAVDVEPPTVPVGPLALLGPDGILLADGRTPPYGAMTHLLRADGSLGDAAPLPMEGEVGQSMPASVTSARGSAILELRPAVRLRAFGPDRSPRWEAVLVEGARSENAFVVETCESYVVLFREGFEEIWAGAVSLDGRVLASPRVFAEGRVHAATWDGRTVVVSVGATRGGEGQLFEFSPRADLVERTPVDRAPQAAFGVEAGLAVLLSDTMSAVNELTLVERGSGRVLEVLATLRLEGYAIDAEVFLGEDRSALVASSLGRRDQLTLFGMQCSP